MRSARTARRATAPVSASTPVGRSTAITARAAVVEVAQRLHRVGDRALRHAACAGAEQSVEREVPLVARSDQSLELGLAADPDRRDPGLDQPVQRDARVAAHALGVSGQPDDDVGAAPGQVARGDESIAAIVAAAAQHQHAQRQHRAVPALHRRDHARAGALHQLGAGGVTAVDGRAVERAHLLRGQDPRHGRSRGRRSAFAGAAARIRSEIAQQARAVGGVAPRALDQIRVGRDEGQVEQLGIGLLLEVDPLLLVPHERHRFLDGVERLPGRKAWLKTSKT